MEIYNDTPIYVYGLQGICDLFKVSKYTAQKYKGTWLKPAIVQRGRKIIVNAHQALELFNQEPKKTKPHGRG